MPSLQTGGKVRLIQPLAFADARVSIGDFVTTADGDNTVVIGARAVADVDSIRSIVIGPDASAIEFSPSAIVIGSSALCDGGSDRAVVIGANASAHNASSSSITIGDGAVSDDAFLAITIGSNSSTIDSNVGSTTTIGDQAASTTTSRSVLIGPRSSSLSESQCVVLGAQASSTSSNSTVVIGFAATANAGSTQSVILGSQADSSSPNTVVLGSSAHIGTGSDNTIVIGNQASAADNTTNSIIIGYQASTLGTSNSSVIVIGVQASCQDVCDSTVILGYQAQASDHTQSAVVLGSHASSSNTSTDAIVIGSSASLIGGAPSSAAYSIAIGYRATARSQGTIVINTTETGTLSTVDDSSDLAVAIGYSTTVATSPSGFALGRFCSLTVSHHSTVFGHNSTINQGIYSLALGTSNTIDDPFSAMLTVADAHIAVGTGNAVNGFFGQSSDGSSAFGVSNFLSGDGSIVVGRSNFILNSDSYVFGIGCTAGGGDTNAVLIGHFIDAFSDVTTNSITIGVGAHAHTGVFTIGDSSFLSGGAAIHVFTIRGYNGGALDTIVATDNPAVAGQVGLNVVLNTGAGFVNKDIFGAEVPPGGSLLLHVSP